MVPADVPSELKVYISTSDGLQPAPSGVQIKPENATEEIKKDRLTADDFVIGITNHGYISEDEVCRPGGRDEERSGGMKEQGSGEFTLGQLILKEEGEKGLEQILSNNNHVNLDPSLYSTGAIPKRKLET